MTGVYEALLSQLGLPEKAVLTGGDDDWHSAPIERVGIPRLKVTDGPVGARGESYVSATSALFPCASALGATFDTDLVSRVGAAIGDEVRTKGAHVLLGPTLNLHRHPQGGRNFESYGEDPMHVARTGAAFIRGVQGRGVGACAKHLVANDAEIERLTISSEVDETTLREVYLLPFEAAVKDAGVWTVMGAYNRLNGTYACEHHWLLTQLLKGEWGFDGLVMSDWHAAHDTVRCAHAGLDLEMPGPAAQLGGRVADAVRQGAVSEASLTDAARRLLRTLDRVEATLDESPERSDDDPQRWALARDAAAAAMVLLRNEPVNGAPLLPLDPMALRRVAVVGPNAEIAVVQGGGSARVAPHRTASPVEGLRTRLGDGVEIVVEQGAVRSRQLPVLDGRLAHHDGRGGVRVEYRSRGREPV
ncbi:MAG TPA: glycoside hydrolase family 3 N-terminal domain-containing protein, partial [Acidimicrobiales bacterium]